MKNWWLYVLKLEEGKYYVGITSKTPEERFKEHKNGFMAAKWTKKYKPVSIYYTKNLGMTSREKAEHIENVTLSRYADKYGLKNVRGGNMSYDGRYRQFLWFNIYFKDVDFTNLMYGFFFLFAFGILFLMYLFK
jgi:predicted GIY-YIG superfamily endonuclease